MCSTLFHPCGQGLRLGTLRFAVTEWAVALLSAQNEKSDPFRDRYKEAREGGKSLGKAMQGIVPYGTPKEKSRILEEGCKHRKFYGLFCCLS